MPTVPAKMKKQPESRNTSASRSVIRLISRLGGARRHAEKRQRDDRRQQHQHQRHVADGREFQPRRHQQQNGHAGGREQQRGQQAIAVGGSFPGAPEPGAEIEKQKYDRPRQHADGHDVVSRFGSGTENRRAIRRSRRCTDSSPPSASVCTISTCSSRCSSALSVPGNRLITLISNVLGWPSGIWISCSKKRGDTGRRGCRERQATSMPPRNDSTRKKPANSINRKGFHQNGSLSASHAASPPPISAASTPTGQPARPSNTSHSENSTRNPWVAHVIRERTLVFSPFARAAAMSPMIRRRQGRATDLDQIHDGAVLTGLVVRNAAHPRATPTRSHTGNARSRVRRHSSSVRC